MTGIPVNKIASHEMKKLSEMTDSIKKKIVGQDDAIQKRLNQLEEIKLA